MDSSKSRTQSNPNTRDLVDPITGRTVARVVSSVVCLRKDSDTHVRTTNSSSSCSNATRQLCSINEVTQEAVRLNVAPQDQVVAIRVMADFMRDPVKTLRVLG